MRFRAGFCIVLALCLALLPAGSASSAQVTPTPSGTVTTIHIVQRGETLYRIALLYGSSVDAIVQANGLANPSQIQVGQRLIIPNAQRGSSPDVASAPGAVVELTVGLSDSLDSLAARYGTTPGQIAARNHILNPALLYAGQPLSVRAGAEGRALTAGGAFYTYTATDTLYGVAARAGVTLSALLQANHLNEGVQVYPGQRLLLPVKGRALADLPAPLDALFMQPETSQQGRTFTLFVQTQTPTQISGSLLGQQLVDHTTDGLAHRLWVGVPALLFTGIYPLTLTCTAANGTSATITRNLAVQDGGYFSERIALPANQLDLLDPKVTTPEFNQIMTLVAPSTPRLYLTGPLGLPVPAPVTSQFGTRRSYNGGPFDQFHSGTDFAGAPGSPIYAPAPGKVVFTGQLYVRGNATIIDHGFGIYTGYWHQSQILVKVGDEVQQGQLIGKIGATGRVTGPHLHWEVFVNGVQVDPIQWARAGLVN